MNDIELGLKDGFFGNPKKADNDKYTKAYKKADNFRYICDILTEKSLISYNDEEIKSLSLFVFINSVLFNRIYKKSSIENIKYRLKDIINNIFIKEINNEL